MVDTGNTARSADEPWLGFGRRLAVAAGALAALVSLLVGAPLSVASLRGALTCAGVWAVARAGGRLLALVGASPGTPPKP